MTQWLKRGGNHTSASPQMADHHQSGPAPAPTSESAGRCSAPSTCSGARQQRSYRSQCHCSAPPKSEPAEHHAQGRFFWGHGVKSLCRHCPNNLQCHATKMGQATQQHARPPGHHRIFHFFPRGCTGSYVPSSVRVVLSDTVCMLDDHIKFQKWFKNSDGRCAGIKINKK